MHHMRVQNTQESKATRGQAYPSEIARSIGLVPHFPNASCSHMSLLEEFSISDFPQSFTSQPYRFVHDFVGSSVDCFSLDRFPADSLGQQAPFNTHGVGAVGNVAIFLSPSTPD